MTGPIDADTPRTMAGSKKDLQLMFSENKIAAFHVEIHSIFGEGEPLAFVCLAAGLLDKLFFGPRQSDSDGGVFERERAAEMIGMAVCTEDDLDLCGVKAIFPHTREQGLHMVRPSWVDKQRDLAIHDDGVAVHVLGVVPEIEIELVAYSHTCTLPFDASLADLYPVLLDHP